MMYFRFLLGFIFIFSPYGVFAQSQKAFFSDITQNPYKEAIYHLQEKSIIKGYDDGSFHPEKLINRAEFLKIVIGALYPEEVQREDLRKQCFEDITDSQTWYVPYACLAREKNIIHGYEGRYLQAENTINLVEASKIIANSYTDYTFDEENSDPWFRPYMNYLINNKLLPFTLTRFEQKITRGEMAELMSRVLRRDENTLSEYLDFREKNYGEVTALTWKEMSGEMIGKTSPETIIDAYNIPRNSREVISTPHPGEYVQSGYLSTYEQWTDASYPPHVSNHTLSLEREAQLREELFSLLNQEREQIDVPSLDFHPTLNQVAQNFAEHLVINAFYGHMDKEGQKPLTRLRNAGYEGFASESMVWKKKDMPEAVEWWQNSDLHWKNIINPRYKNIGIGISEEPGGGYLIILLTGE